MAFKIADLNYQLNTELFSPHYIYNGLGGKGLWTKAQVDGFTEVAQRFEASPKRNRHYIPHSEGSTPYLEFWKRELFRIENGLTIDGQWIPGMYYFYLNYCRIHDKVKKLDSFPNFWDLDADYFSKLDESMKAKQHFAIFKKRQSGFSFKGGVPIVYNLHRYPGSMNYLMSFLEAHADKTWSFVKNYLNHINQYTAFYKNRDPDSNSFIKMSYKEFDEYGRKLERGYKSELHKVAFKDSAEKGVGGAITLAVLEESGVWPNILEVLEFIKPATQAGTETTGQIIIYGSVGDIDKSKGLKTIFYSPEDHNFWSTKNFWSMNEDKGKNTAYFVPEFMCMNPHIDSCGNSDVEASLVSINKERTREKRKSPKLFSFYISQHPLYPEEGFLSRNSNKFPVDLCMQWKSKLLSQDKLKFAGFGAKLFLIDGKVTQKLLPEFDTPLTVWPVDLRKLQADFGGLAEGVCWIYQPPEDNAPESMYIASTDSVDQNLEGAITSESLFALYIYKRGVGDLTKANKKELVASLIGRPEIIQDIYLQAELLCKAYNARNLVENANVGIINFHYHRGSDWLLQDEMTEIKGINVASQVKRRKGYHPTAEVKNHGDNLMITYMKEIIGYEYNLDGTVNREIFGVERIPDPGLLEEFINFAGKDTNCDRIDAFRGCLLFEEALTNDTIRLESDQDPMAVLSHAFNFRKNKVRSAGWSRLNSSY